MMKQTKKILCIAAVTTGLILSGCGANNTIKGAGIGAGAGAVIGSVIGKTAGNTAAGAAIGGVIGGATGGIIGSQMDKQAKELEAQLPEAEVEKVNNGEAIKVTFDSGILFATNSSTLSATSREALIRFAENMNANPDTDIRIIGHTDSTGKHEYNMQLSEKRAESVMNFLRGQNVAAGRMIPLGVGPDQPLVDNSTPANRAKNRRVEVYIVPNAKMIKEAERKAGK